MHRVKRSLEVLDPGAEALGAPTIMDRGLAARWGVPYVHLAVFAIDIDRIREALDADESAAPDAESRAWPFGWEVFVTAIYARDHLDPVAHAELIDDACTAVIEAAQLGDGATLGNQLPFSVYDLVHREVWPQSLRSSFTRWERRPSQLSRRLDPLWADEAAEWDRLRGACLALDIVPPLAAPTRSVLEQPSPRPG
jgi:hypothetical protein